VRHPRFGFPDKFSATEQIAIGPRAAAPNRRESEADARIIVSDLGVVLKKV
jgi:hypothetical protein